MLGRKKHKRMELERGPRKRSRALERTPEQIAFTRRAFVFRGLAASSFIALTGRLWQLQVVQYDAMKGQGQAFTQRYFPLKAARGLIYDRNRQLLADNRKSWAVTIVPANLPDSTTERDAIYKTLATSLGMGPLAVIVPKELLPEARDETYARLAAVLGVASDVVRQPVEDELASAAKQKRAALNMIAVSRELAADRAAAVATVALDLPGVRVVNPIKYQVDNTFDYFVPLIVKRGIPKDLALGIEANRLYLPGVQIDDQTLSRHYYVGEELAHILGYTGPISKEEYDAAVVTDDQGAPLLDNNGQKQHRYAYDDFVGKSAIEASLEDQLRGQAGGYVAQVTARGQIAGEFTQYRRNPVDGKSVVLTVSTDFQRDVITQLQSGIDAAKKYVEDLNVQKRAEGKKEHPLPPGTGAVVALDPQTGKILALVSLPSYDQRLFANGISQQQLDALLETNVPPEQRRYPLQNRCVANTFPPGSTLKTFMALAGLQEGRIKPDTKLKCLGQIDVPSTWDELQRNKYWCWTRDASHGEQEVRLALADSCDVFFYILGAPKQKDERGIDLHFYEPGNSTPLYFNGLGIDKINQYLTAVGFGAKSGIELSNEVAGLVPGPDWKQKTFPDNYWSVGDTIVTSIGQGYDLVTPLQLCNATAAVANGGTLYRPTLVHELLDSQGQTVKPFKPEVLRKLPVDRAHIEVVREGMRMNVTDPKGLVYQKFSLPSGIDAGVKTGTAEYGDQFDEQGLALRAHAWTAAFAPYNNPRICVVAFVEGGSASATVAAPVAASVISAYFARFGGTV